MGSMLEELQIKGQQKIRLEQQRNFLYKEMGELRQKLRQDENLLKQIEEQLKTTSREFSALQSQFRQNVDRQHELYIYKDYVTSKEMRALNLVGLSVPFKNGDREPIAVVIIQPIIKKFNYEGTEVKSISLQKGSQGYAVGWSKECRDAYLYPQIQNLLDTFGYMIIAKDNGVNIEETKLSKDSRSHLSIYEVKSKDQATFDRVKRTQAIGMWV